MKRKVLFCLFMIAAIRSNASNLKIENIEFRYDPDANIPCHAILTLTWSNGWSNAKNHDAAWLFFKLRETGRSALRHIKVEVAGHTLVADFSNTKVLPTFYVSKDKVGLFVFPQTHFRGNITWKLKIMLDKSAIDMNRVSFLKVFGIEMVNVPEGSFYIGDSDTSIHKKGGIFSYDTKGPFKISNETSTIEVGEKPGAIFYSNANLPQYRGDQKGPLPASFPKGVHSFYIMKYEITQGQYADFLNSIHDDELSFRYSMGSRAYTRSRGTIGFDQQAEIFKTGHPTRPMNFISWDDGCAFADWSGLRPYTEFEYTKAARGTVQPIPGDFPWGTSEKKNIMRYYNDNGDLVMENGSDEKDLVEKSKDIFGASYYWVMDLSGSLWERVITIGDETGRNFKGTHGDGTISNYGVATNEDWPKGVDKAKGYGYRGGGVYDLNMRSGEFIPHSKVEHRPFASWSEGPRVIAYGFRCARTAD